MNNKLNQGKKPSYSVFKRVSLWTKLILVGYYDCHFGINDCQGLGTNLAKRESIRSKIEQAKAEKEVAENKRIVNTTSELFKSGENTSAVSMVDII